MFAATPVHHFNYNLKVPEPLQSLAESRVSTIKLSSLQKKKTLNKKKRKNEKETHKAKQDKIQKLWRKSIQDIRKSSTTTRPPNKDI